MKRLAVAAVCVLVALSASALGEPVWTWSWNYPVRPTDVTYDHNNQSDLWLTRNSGTHAVALAWAAGDFWTTVVAEVEKPYVGYCDSVMSYDWSPDSRDSFPVWRLDWDQHPNPSLPCVSANDSFKFYMCVEAFDPGIAEWQCVGASSLTDELAVRYRVNFTTASTTNTDSTFANTCYPVPGGSGWLFPSFENWDDAEESYFLTSRRSRSGGNGWQQPVQIEQGHNTQPSMATGIGDGSYVYVAYRTPSGSILFERSSDHGENWGSQYTLSSEAGKWPCIAALGQFVFACWHNVWDKIVYRFSTNGGITWSAPVSKADLSYYAQTNVSAAIVDGRKRVLLTCRRQIGSSYYTYFEFGTLVGDHISWSEQMHLSTRSQGNADLRPSLATALSGTQNPQYSGRLVYGAPIPSYKRGFYMFRGGPICIDV